MLFLSAVLNPVEENCANVVRILARERRLKISRSAVRKIKEHPSYPSMQSISDLLHDWKVENAGLKIQHDKYRDLPVPFIAQIKETIADQAFVVVKEYSDERVVISDYLTSKWRPLKTATFLEQATGYALLAEPTKSAGEKDYKRSRTKEIFHKAPGIIAVILVLLLCAILIVQSFRLNGWAGLSPAGLIILKFFGCYISALLLWYEIDQHNPLLQKVCQGGKKTNCGAILKSAAARIAGISWSEIGAFYFTGGLLTLLFGGLSPVSVFAIAWLNVIALPYTLFSIYYQWLVEKQWCVLCLTIQGILVTEFLVSLAGNVHSLLSLSDIPSIFFVNALLCFTLPVLAWFLLKPLLQTQKENRLLKSTQAKTKYNLEIFDALLQNQKAIEKSTEGLGIVIGPANARNKVIKVCNPYCGPCATAHSAFHDLLESSEDLQLQIIFTATSDEKDYRAIAAKHLMAIAGKNIPELTKQALDDWYLSPKKDYPAFAAKYPMNGELNEQDEKLEAMSNWCRQTVIRFTPTIFINNHQLPENYSVADLKYFLNG